MKNKIVLSTLVSLMAVTTVVTANTGDSLSKDKLMELKRSSKLLQNPSLKIEKGMDKDSVYFLKIEAQGPRGPRPLTAFLDKKTGAIYFGGGFDKNGDQMKFPVDAQKIKDGVAFSFGNGKKEIYVVTDPECPYCQKFEKAAKGKLDDYTVHVIFMPLSFHKNAPAMVEWILSGKTDAEKKERMEKVMIAKDTSFKDSKAAKEFIEKSKKANDLIAKLRAAQQKKDTAKVNEYKNQLQALGNGFDYSPEIAKLVDRGNLAAQELGARGTPSVFDDKFNSIEWPSLVAPAKKPLQVKKVENSKKAEAPKQVEEAKKAEATKK